MNKLKKLKKRIRQLEAGIQKRTKKLAKLRHEAATRADLDKKKSTDHAKVTPRTAKPSARKAKRKSGLTPEGRAKLAALMQARWAAKRAAAPTSAAPH